MKPLLLKGILLSAFPILMIQGIGQTSLNAEVRTAYDTTIIKHGQAYLVDKITANDDKNIKAKAESIVVRFMNLLNTIATGLDLEVPETEGIIRKSYLPVDSKIFYDSSVVVVDDLRKVEQLSQAKEKTAYSYLRDFEIFYKKSEDASVSFSNFRISNIKKGNYLYIKVTYDCLFGNKSKISDEPFSVQKRVAELRIEKYNNKWKTWIIDVHFLDSMDLAEANKNDITIVADQANAPDSTVSDTESDSFVLPASKTLLDPIEREALRRKNDSIRTYMAFRNLVDSGKHSLNRGQYIIAYQFFNEAETVTNGSKGIIGQGDMDFLQTMIRETRKNIEASHRTTEELYAAYMQEAMLHKNQRSYDKALEAYNKALTSKPGDEAAMQKKRVLTTVISNLTRFEAQFLAGKYKDAIRDYDKAIKSDPQNSDYYLGRGKCFERIRESKKAMIDYKRAIEVDENNLQAYKAKGNLHEEQKDYANALSCYTVCSSLDKNDINTILKVAKLNMLIGNPAAAVAALDKGIVNNDAVSALYLQKADLLYAMKQPKKAIEAFSVAIGLDSSNADAYLKRGLCYNDLKQITMAATDFETARRFGIDSISNNVTSQIADDYFTSAINRFKVGYSDSSITLLNYSILINPGKSQYRFQRGQYYLFMKKDDQAIQDFTDAILLDAHDENAYQLRGLAKYRKLMYREAISDFQYVIKLNPKLPETFKYAGDALLKVEDYVKAIASYDAALTAGKSKRNSLKDSLMAELYNGKGDANFYLGKHSDAIQNFNQSIKINKAAPEVYYNRSKTYLKLNKLKEAEEDILKSLSYEPRNALWNSKLGEIYYYKGKFDRAIAQYNMAIPKEGQGNLWLDAVYLRGKSYVNINDHADAYKDFRTIQLSGLQKNYPEINTDLGYVFIAFNKPDSALAYFEKENRNASDPMSIYGTAVVYVQKNQVDQAFQWLEKAVATRKLARSIISNDQRIQPIRNDKRYKKLMKKYY